MTRRIRPNADPNSPLERAALERRLAGVQRAHAVASEKGDTAAVERYETLIAAMLDCLSSGKPFFSLHRHRSSNGDASEP
jgi:hypothetical protein